MGATGAVGAAVLPSEGSTSVGGGVLLPSMAGIVIADGAGCGETAEARPQGRFSMAVGCARAWHCEFGAAPSVPQIYITLLHFRECPNFFLAGDLFRAAIGNRFSSFSVLHNRFYTSLPYIGLVLEMLLISHLIE